MLYEVITGAIPPRRGIPLPALPEDRTAVIVHLEDEPAALYQEIVQAGLHLGTKLRRGESSGSHVRLVADGVERELSPVAAANVTVSPLADEAEVV